MQGEPERFTVRVPSERDLPTVAVRVLFPAQVSVYAVKPIPGWSIELLLTRDKRNRGVVYRGGAIRADEFQEFDLLGTPRSAGTAVWKSEQTYSDGGVKSWTGPPESDGEAAPETGVDAPGPASATEILPEGSTAEVVEVSGDGDGDSGSSQAGIWLGVIAIGVSALAALGVGLLWSTRPARLPEEDE